MTEIFFIVVSAYASLIVGVSGIFRGMNQENVPLTIAGFCHCAIGGYAFATLLERLLT